MNELLNQGNPITMYNDISASRLLSRSNSTHCTPMQKKYMEYVAVLMQTEMPITKQEFSLAEKALKSVEKKMRDELTIPVMVDYMNAAPPAAKPFKTYLKMSGKFTWKAIKISFVVIITLIVVIANYKAD